MKNIIIKTKLSHPAIFSHQTKHKLHALKYVQTKICKSSCLATFVKIHFLGFYKSMLSATKSLQFLKTCRKTSMILHIQFILDKIVNMYMLKKPTCLKFWSK